MAMRQLLRKGELSVTLVRSGSDGIMSLLCCRVARPLDQEAGDLIQSQRPKIYTFRLLVS